MQLLCYIGLRLPHVFSTCSSTSKAYQPSAAASHNSQMFSCLDVLDWESSCIWPTFARSLLPLATSQHKVALDVSQHAFSTSVGKAKAMTSNHALLHHSKACEVHRELEYEDVWAMFGEGRHPHIERLYDTKLAPFLSQSANHFWQNRLWYFKQGLYYQGGMVSALALLQLWSLFMCFLVSEPNVPS